MSWVDFQICHIPNVEEASKYLLSDNIDAPSITKYGFLVGLDAQTLALRAQCAKGGPHVCTVQVLCVHYVQTW